MKTSTIVKICSAIFLCLIFLALIGKKRRETFEQFGNANPDESRSMEINGGGYTISDEDDNHLSNLDLDKKYELPTNRFCQLSNKTDEQREGAIQQEAMKAKAQLDAYLKREIEKQKEVQISSRDKATPCTYLRFPAIL